MKKIFLALLIFGMCSLSFARVYITQDITGLCLSEKLDYNCFKPANKLSSGFSVDPLLGFSGAAGWEFNTSNLDTPWHFGVGAALGLQLYGFTLGGQFNASYLLKDLGKLRLELCGTIEAGDNAVLDFCGGGGEYLYIKNTVDVLLMSNTRRGFYGGLGISNLNAPYLCIYKEYGAYTGIWSILGLHAQVSLRI